MNDAEQLLWAKTYAAEFALRTGVFLASKQPGSALHIYAKTSDVSKDAHESAEHAADRAVYLLRQKTK